MDVGHLAGQLLAQLDAIELCHTSFRDDLGGGRSRHVVGVLDQRVTSGAPGPEQHLVVLEVRRLEQDADAVGQGPPGHPEPGEGVALDDLGQQRQLGSDRLPGDFLLVRLDPLFRDAREHRRQLLLGGHLHPLLLRGEQGDDAVLLPRPGVGEGVDLGEPDSRQQLPVELQFLLEAGNRLPVQQVVDVVVGKGGRLPLVALAVGLLHPAQHLLLLPLELTGGEAELSHPFHFGQDCLDPGFETVVLDTRSKQEELLRTHHPHLPPHRERERRLRQHGQLVQALVDHAAVQPLDQEPPVVACGPLPAHILFEKDADPVGRRLRIGGDREQGLLVVGHRVDDPLRGIPPRLQSGEMLAHLPFDPFRVEVSDRHEPHQLGPVPLGIELTQAGVPDRVEHRFFTDRQALGVAGILQDHRELPVPHPLHRPSPQPPLLDHHAPLLFDLLGIQGHGVGPVLEDPESRIDELRAVGRHGQHVHGFVEAGEGVEVRPQAHADALEIVDQLLLCEVGGAVEGHVLEEVSHSLLPLFFEDGAGVDGQVELGPVPGLAVGVDQVAEAVLQLAGDDLRIEGERGLEGGIRPRGFPPGGSGFLSCGAGRNGRKGEA